MKHIFGTLIVVALGIAAGFGFANTASAKAKAHKVGICHGTASDKNPYVYIVVDESAIAGHFDGTAPGHGKNNYPDFLSADGTCDNPPQGES